MISKIFCDVYIGLTFLKLTQWAIYAWTQRRNNNNKKEMYTASVSVIMNLLSWSVSAGLGESTTVQKIPRKKFREITDVWVEAYNRKHTSSSPSRPPQQKTYTSLSEATRDIYREFTQDASSAYVVDVLKHAPLSYLRQPLGISGLISLMLFVVFLPLFVLRELFLSPPSQRDRAPYIMLCKFAVASTITDMYVVAGKENIDFDTAMFKYPWVSGIFSREQIHPMIGGAVCPMYKRSVSLPIDSVSMDFDIEILPSSSGVLMIRQVYSSWWKNLLSNLLAAHCVMIVGTLCYLAMSHEEDPLGWNLLSALLPYALFFYAVRTMADQSMGIEWMDIYKYYP